MTKRSDVIHLSQQRHSDGLIIDLASPQHEGSGSLCCSSLVSSQPEFLSRPECLGTSLQSNFAFRQSPWTLCLHLPCITVMLDLVHFVLCFSTNPQPSPQLTCATGIAKRWIATTSWRSCKAAAKKGQRGRHTSSSDSRCGTCCETAGSLFYATARSADITPRARQINMQGIIGQTPPSLKAFVHTDLFACRPCGCCVVAACCSPAEKSSCHRTQENAW